MDVALDVDAGAMHVDGGLAEVLRRSTDAALAGRVLAVVIETSGSTYARAGDTALYAAGRRVAGWLTGGCLEDWIAQQACDAGASSQVQYLELDQRGDHALLDPSAPGCRGRQRIAFIPVEHWQGWPDCVQAWRDGVGALSLQVDPRHGVTASCVAHGTARVPGAAAPAWLPAPRTLSLPQPPTLALIGGGPEAPLLLQMAAELGWRTIGVENRARWMARVDQADIVLPISVDAFFATPHAVRCAAILAMSHNVERDVLALEGAATTAARYVGLLGPRSRRDDVLRLLAAGTHAALHGRLHAPVGLPFAARGPAAIATSVVAHLLMEFAGERDRDAPCGADPRRRA